MAEKRRNSTGACKREAIRLVTEPGNGVGATARNLGITANRLGRWKRAYEQQENTAFPGNGRVSADQEELQRLRGEKKRLRMERDSLNKALGFCASESD